MRPIYECPKNVQESLTICRNFEWALLPIDAMNMRTKFEVRIALPVPEIVGRTQKIGQSLDTRTLPFLQNF